MTIGGDIERFRRTALLLACTLQRDNAFITFYVWTKPMVYGLWSMVSTGLGGGGLVYTYYWNRRLAKFGAVFHALNS